MKTDLREVCRLKTCTTSCTLQLNAAKHALAKRRRRWSRRHHATGELNEHSHHAALISASSPLTTSRSHPRNNEPLSVTKLSATPLRPLEEIHCLACLHTLQPSVHFLLSLPMMAHSTPKTTTPTLSITCSPPCWACPHPQGFQSLKVALLGFMEFLIHSQCAHWTLVTTFIFTTPLPRAAATPRSSGADLSWKKEKRILEVHLLGRKLLEISQKLCTRRGRC